MTKDENWKTNIIGQKSKNYYNHLQRSVSYKDMTDENFTPANQELIGNCVHGMKILLLAKSRRMAIIINDRNDKMSFRLSYALSRLGYRLQIDLTSDWRLEILSFSECSILYFIVELSSFSERTQPSAVTRTRK